MGSAGSKHKEKKSVVEPTPTPEPMTKKIVQHPKIAGSTETKDDVMISYSHQDMDTMKKIEDALIKEGVTVWVDQSSLTPGAVFLREIGEAIVASKLFIVILSADSVTSKYCQDELSLAYISNKTIFAVSSLPFDEISAVMDLGMKLTLACVQWTFLNENANEEIDNFVTSVKSALDKLKEEAGSNDDSDVEKELKQNVEESEEEPLDTSVMNKQAVAYRLKEKRETSNDIHVDVPDDEAAIEFWKIHFKDEKSCDWTLFQETMINSFSTMWTELNVSVELRKQLFSSMATEMNVINNTLQRSSYITFCTKGKEILSLDEAIKLHATAALAVREVFNMDSSVRLTAIENLGDHKSKAVIKILLDLLYDEETDVKVVAAISLAHAASEFKKPKIRSEVVNGLLGCLSNDDRLVRESGCLALGRMKSKTAIKKLLYLWRNDYISSVREAAQIAIKQIGGDEAEAAMHVTKVLSSEIDKLK